MKEVTNRIKYFFLDVISVMRYIVTGYCGNACHWTSGWGFVPECGCPVHDGVLFEEPNQLHDNYFIYDTYPTYRKVASDREELLEVVGYERENG